VRGGSVKGKRECKLEEKRGSGLFSCELERAWLKVEIKTDAWLIMHGYLKNI
jgi:hypothetical protein